MLNLERLNTMPAAEAAEQFRACCGSSRWVDAMVSRRPFASVPALLAAANDAWQATGPTDWDEAFAHHPRIGERRAAAPVTAAAETWSAGEQSGVSRATESVRAAMAEANEAYQQRFGRIYIVCAAGRSAEDLLADVESRMRNDPETELSVAAEEQRKIMVLRLGSLVGSRAS